MSASTGNLSHISDGRNQPSRFQPREAIDESPKSLNVPDELWLTILESPCTFPPVIFNDVMFNLVKNPNVTSSHLFRADIFYDSDKDPSTYQDEDGNVTEGKLIKHLKASCRPIRASLPGYSLLRTIVRELIPRNPKLDRSLLQTCHFFQKRAGQVEEENIVLYIPHVDEASDVPFYHPRVQRLAFQHSWRLDEETVESGSVSVSFQFFPEEPMSAKLSRTALRLLQTIHKHGQGRLAGYEKRVHLDQIIPQKRYQDTYTRLKASYGKKLATEWVEVTDPGKHVFEDLGIAAFLIELWRDTYQVQDREEDDHTKPSFPGFVDIGCGNGILTYVLLSEGFTGWGFDARQRKSWSTFPEDVRARLQRRILVPDLSESSEYYGFTEEKSMLDNELENTECLFHNGLFPRGTFIISNHADELTAWTPLLAYLNDGAFIAIPCCSHDLSGARFRAPGSTKLSRKRKSSPSGRPLLDFDEGEVHTSMPLPTSGAKIKQKPSEPASTKPTKTPETKDLRSSQAPETGDLRSLRSHSMTAPIQSQADAIPGDRNKHDVNTKSNNTKMPSAYSTLCSYVQSMTVDVGFRAETEVLRIPSTRNTCIVGRQIQGPRPIGQSHGDGMKKSDDSDRGEPDILNIGEELSLESRKEMVKRIIELETGRVWEVVIAEWTERAEKLRKKPGSGH